jgi:hypothetical protein
MEKDRLDSTTVTNNLDADVRSVLNAADTGMADNARPSPEVWKSSERAGFWPAALLKSRT